MNLKGIFMRQVLCAMRSPNGSILQEIYRFGHCHGWQIECYEGRFPPGWFGDGVLSDSFSLEELKEIREIDHIPVVSFTLPPHGNVRTVAGDTRTMAVMVADYFQDKGFCNFAAIDARNWNQADRVADIDPVVSLKEELARRGLSLEICYWQENLRPEKLTDYGWIVERLSSFFLALPRPVALFISNGRHLAVVYRIISRLGIRVPEEFAVLCNSDNSCLLENASIPTSHICGEPFEMGRKAAELLERMMNGESVPSLPVRVTPSAIVSRHSTDAFTVSNPKLAMAVEFLCGNYMNFISVEDAAAAAGISSSMLVRLFQRHLRKSPSEFLRGVRLNQACCLLDKSDLPLSAIAQKIGYGSAMSFSTAFQQRYRVAPGEYRRIRRRAASTAGA